MATLKEDFVRKTTLNLDEEADQMLISLAIYFNNKENKIFSKNEIISICIENARLNSINKDLLNVLSIKSNSNIKQTKKIFYSFQSIEQRQFIYDFIQYYKNNGYKIFLNSAIKTFIYETYIKLII